MKRSAICLSRRTFPVRRLRPELDRARTSLMRLPCGFLQTKQREPGGRGRIRTSVARKERQIYSLLVLATHPPVPKIHPGHNNCIPQTLLRRQLYVPKTISKTLPAPQAKTQKGLVSKDTSPLHLTARIRSASLPPKKSWWSWRRELNPRPSDYKSDALPAELRQRCANRLRIADRASKLQGGIPVCSTPIARPVENTSQCSELSPNPYPIFSL
jgi:hypothetical protein